MDVSASNGDSEGQEVWCAAVHGVAKSWTQLSNQITTIRCLGREIWEAFGTKMSVMEKKQDLSESERLFQGEKQLE